MAEMSDVIHDPIAEMGYPTRMTLNPPPPPPLGDVWQAGIVRLLMSLSFPG